MQSSSQIVTTKKQTPSFFTGRMPFLSPDQQLSKALREKVLLLLQPRKLPGFFHDSQPTVSRSNEKSVWRRCKHWAQAVRWSQKFRPATDPFPQAQDGQNLISWRWSLPFLQTQFGEDRCMQFRVIVVTDPQTNKHTNPQTDRGDYNTLCHSLARSVTRTHIQMY